METVAHLETERERHYRLVAIIHIVYASLGLLIGLFAALLLFGLSVLPSLTGHGLSELMILRIIGFVAIGVHGRNNLPGIDRGHRPTEKAALGKNSAAHRGRVRPGFLSDWYGHRYLHALGVVGADWRAEGVARDVEDRSGIDLPHDLYLRLRNPRTTNATA